MPSTSLQRDDRRIIFMSGLMLIITLLLAGLLSYGFRQMQVQDAATSGIKLLLDSTAQLIGDQFKQSIAENQAIAHDTILRQGLEKTNVPELRAEGIDLLKQFAGKWIDKPFSAIRIDDSSNAELFNSNHQLGQDLIALDIMQGMQTKLTWNGQFNLSHTRADANAAFSARMNSMIQSGMR